MAASKPDFGRMHTALADFDDGATGGIWYPTGLLPGREDFREIVQDEADTLGRPTDIGASGLLVQAVAGVGSVPLTTVYAGTDGKGALADALFGPAFRLSLFERFPDGDPTISGAGNKFGTAPFDAPQDNKIKTTIWALRVLVVGITTPTLSIVDYEDPTTEIFGGFDLAINGFLDTGGIPLNRGWGIKLVSGVASPVVSVQYTIDRR